MIVNRDQLADVLGLSAQTITEYVKQGLPVVQAGRGRNGHKYDTADCIAWINSRGKSAVADKFIAIEAEQARTAKAKADITEMERDVMAGTLILAEEVRQTMYKVASATRKTLQNIPKKISAELAALGGDEHAVRTMLIHEIEQVCEELADATGYDTEDFS